MFCTISVFGKMESDDPQQTGIIAGTVVAVLFVAIVGVAVVIIYRYVCFSFENCVSCNRTCILFVKILELYRRRRDGKGSDNRGGFISILLPNRKKTNNKYADITGEINQVSDFTFSITFDSVTGQNRTSLV